MGLEQECLARIVNCRDEQAMLGRVVEVTEDLRVLECGQGVCRAACVLRVSSEPDGPEVLEQVEQTPQDRPSLGACEEYRLA